MKARAVIEAETPKQYLMRTKGQWRTWEVYRQSSDTLILHTPGSTARLGLDVDRASYCVRAEFYSLPTGRISTAFPGTDILAVLVSARTWAADFLT
jgi:hypothetical protein